LRQNRNGETLLPFKNRVLWQRLFVVVSCVGGDLCGPRSCSSDRLP
jgi:hypothetical protein